jgi:hypothetical protein
MKRFIFKTLMIAVVFFFIIEVFSMLLLDPLYFDSINTYDEKNKSKKEVYDKKLTDHVDFLFVGSSRIPATINPGLFSELSNGVVINAGRGYMTPGIHFQALKNKLKNHPNFLKNSVVLLEYPGSDIYTLSFEEDFLKVHEPEFNGEKAMPHLLLPHLDYDSFFAFFTKSQNSLNVKFQMLGLMSASFRGFQYVNDRFHASSKPLFHSKANSNLVSEGGIRSDRIKFVKEKAIIVASKEKEMIKNSPVLTFDQLEKSSISKLREIVINNGGIFMLYEMPLHSVQKDIYSSEKAQKNKEVFEAWLKEKHILIVHNSDFAFNDNDFPDTFHLSGDRRDEFTEKLYSQINKTLRQ